MPCYTFMLRSDITWINVMVLGGYKLSGSSRVSAFSAEPSLPSRYGSLSPITSGQMQTINALFQSYPPIFDELLCSRLIGEAYKAEKRGEKEGRVENGDVIVQSNVNCAVNILSLNCTTATFLVHRTEWLVRFKVNCSIVVNLFHSLSLSPSPLCTQCDWSHLSGTVIDIQRKLDL